MKAQQEGKARLSSLFWLAVFAAIVYAAWNVVPVFYSNYNFSDRLIEIARTFKYRATDEQISDMIVNAAKGSGLEEYINRNSCRVQTTESRRIITCHYQRQAKILPGWMHTFVFDLKADQPVI